MMRVGFIGVGNMGLPMARNLLRAGIPLTIWNRSPRKCDELVALGAQRAQTVAALFEGCSIIMIMLLDSAAIDAVLGRNAASLAVDVAGKTIVHLGTTSSEHSSALGRDIERGGGAYVEAPVSGSRLPAEQGCLVGMLAGNDSATQDVMPLLEPLCARVFQCGRVPGALRMKLAVNHYLIGMVVVLAETVHAARRANVDIDVLQQVLDAGPMASAVSRTKMEKITRNDFVAQAAIRDVATIADLVLAQSDDSDSQSPLIRQCAALYHKALRAGLGEQDMAAVIHAFD